MYEGFGRKKSLPHLMERAIDEDLPPNPIIYSAIERPQYRGRKGVLYLAPIHVLACEREAWHDLNLTLMTLPPAKRQASYGLLDKLLRKLDGKFDVCLIDFPGHETGPISKNGLRAARWYPMAKVESGRYPVSLATWSSYSNRVFHRSRSSRITRPPRHGIARAV